MEDLLDQGLKLNRQILEDTYNLLEAKIFSNNHIILKIKLDILEKDRFKLKEKKDVLEIISILENNKGNLDIKELAIIRDKIYSYYETLKSYRTELIYLQDVFNQKVLLEKKRTLQIDYPYSFLNEEKEKILEKLDSLIELVPLNSQEYENLSVVLVKILPFKISKHKYYDKIAKLLFTSLDNKSKNFINFKLQSYKNSTIGCYQKNYGLFYDYYFNKVELYRKDLSSSTSDKNINKDIKETIKFINQDINSLLSLGLFLNNLILLKKIGKILGKENNNIESYLEQKYNEDLVDDRQKQLVESQKELLKYTKNIEKNPGLIDEIDKIFLETTYFIELFNLKIFYNFDIDFNQEIQYIDKQELEILITNFLAYLKRNLNETNRKERRIRMKLLLIDIRNIFSTKLEFKNYIRYSLDSRLVDKEELYIILSLLETFLFQE